MSPSDPCASPFRAPIGATGGLGHGSRLSPRRGWKRLLLTCLRVLGLTPQARNCRSFGAGRIVQPPQAQDVRNTKRQRDLAKRKWKFARTTYSTAGNSHVLFPPQSTLRPSRLSTWKTIRPGERRLGRDIHGSLPRYPSLVNLVAGTFQFARSQP